MKGTQVSYQSTDLIKSEKRGIDVDDVLEAAPRFHAEITCNFQGWKSTPNKAVKEVPERSQREKWHFYPFTQLLLILYITERQLGYMLHKKHKHQFSQFPFYSY